jgi:hypothetical protein
LLLKGINSAATYQLVIKKDYPAPPIERNVSEN